MNVVSFVSLLYERNGLFSLFFFILFLADLTPSANASDLYVSPMGNDSWSGKLAEPNASNTDGPLRTIAAAQKAWRKESGKDANEPIVVYFREGDWEFKQTLELDENDLQAPLSISAFPGETVRFLGSRAVEGLTNGKGKTGLNRPEILSADFDFQSSEGTIPYQLFSTERLIRARTPNFDKSNPYRSGFFYVERAFSASKIAGSVSTIHNAGDALYYDVDVPKQGEWFVWIFYGADNVDVDDMGPRLAMRCGPDGDDDWKTLQSMPKTKSWGPSKWSRVASFDLKKGKQTLGWKNVGGGGCDIGAFLLTNDPDFTPDGEDKLESQSSDVSTIIVQAVDVARNECKNATIRQKGSPNAFVFKNGDVTQACARQDARPELKIFQSGSCRAYLEMTSIKKIDFEKNVVELTGNELTADLSVGDRYWLENCPEFLDEPGEWFYDVDEKTLYVWAPNSEDEVRVPILGTLVRVAPSSDSTPLTSPLTISGISFEETFCGRDEGCVGYEMGERGVIELTNAKNVSVEKCVFNNVGRYAVAIDGGGENAVRKCKLTNGGQGGVVVRSPRNIISDNSFEDIGQEYKHIGGVVLVGSDASENVVEHNSVRRSSRYGISLKNAGVNNVVAYNWIKDVSLETYDTGAIEVTQGDMDFLSGSVINNNYIDSCVGYSSQGTVPTHMAWGIYLDSFAGGYSVENNFVKNCPNGGFMLQGGKKNIVRNNVFLDATSYQGYFANYSNNCEDLVFERNVVCWNNPNSAFFATGSNLEEVLFCDHNLYWNESVQDFFESQAFKSWKSKGFDEHSVFADPKIDDRGRFDQNSPAGDVGFVPFDLKDVGPRK
ncbi:MAG: right-handed parallel beta-helix repeat-containing protein [Thermoguttaceae bacterium]|nr:right-handed parallel beta-helix repeat-containing protein [Thermoguttaceae bacterium]